MKLTQVTFATVAALALAGPALAAGSDERDRTRSSQEMPPKESHRTGPLSAPGSMQEQDTGSAAKWSRSARSDPKSGGYNSSTVREVQQALQKKGIDAGPIDGVFGPKTLSAVRKFQQQQGLATTGRIDQQTLAALSVEASAFGTGAEPRGNAPGSGSDRPDMEPAGTGSGSARTRQ